MDEDPLTVDDIPESDRKILRKIFGKRYGTSKHTKEQIQALANAQLDRLLSRDFLYFRIRKKVANNDPIKHIHYCYYGDEVASVATQMLICIRCRLVISPGGNVSRHLEKCTNKKKKAADVEKSQCRLDGFMAARSVSATHEEKQQITTAVAKWVAANSRPISIVEDSGLKEVIAAALRIGAKRRNVDNFDVTSIIPTRNTVEELFAKSGALVVNHLESVGGSFSADYGKRKEDYITVVVHIIYNWQFHSIHAAMRRCEFAKKDNAQVWSDIVEAAASFGLKDKVLREVFCASDEGSNSQKALRLNNGKNVFCICHVANNILKRTFNPYKNRKQLLFINDLKERDKELVQRGQQILIELKIVVNGVRRTEIGCSLRKKLPLEGETRWLSKLKSAKAFYECAEELFKHRELGKLPEDVKRALRYLYDNRFEFDDVLHILSQFEEFVQFFQKDAANIFDVWPKWYDLKESFNNSELQCALARSAYKCMLRKEDSELQCALARSAYKCMLRKEDDGVVSKFHRMATLLHPKRSQLRNLATESERREIILTLKDFVRELVGRDAGGSQPKPPKLPRTDFDDLEDSGENVVSEVDSYLSASFSFRDKAGNNHDNPLLAWKERASDFPLLSRVVRQLFSIPASTASAEKSFSDLRNLVPEKRETIGADTVFSSLVIRSLLKFNQTLNAG